MAFKELFFITMTRRCFFHRRRRHHHKKMNLIFFHHRHSMHHVQYYIIQTFYRRLYMCVRHFSTILPVQSYISCAKFKVAK